MNELFHTQAGWLSDPLMWLPKRRFMPQGLYQAVVSGRHLGTIGCRQETVTGSSIATDREQCLRAAIGEWVERYSASVFRDTDLVAGTHRRLNATHRLLPLSYYRFYTPAQYRELEAVGVYPLEEDSLVEWVPATDLISGDEVLVPAYCVYLGYHNRLEPGREYVAGITSTGIAAGESLDMAVASGFFECAERHAFARFWYEQERIPYLTYTRETVLDTYGDDPDIVHLTEPPRVKMKFFDLSPFAPLETMAVFLFFPYRGKCFQSLGCAARPSRRDALYKALLEAWQGVEYALSLEARRLLDGPLDLDKVNNFDAHFHFYNRFPEYRRHSRILRDALDTGHGDPWQPPVSRPAPDTGRIDGETLRQMGLEHLIYKELSTADVLEMGYHTARVIAPQWALLTGIHRWPLLGQGFPDTGEHLFTEYPHPFP